jgi:hypothetical protein
VVSSTPIRTTCPVTVNSLIIPSSTIVRPISGSLIVATAPPHLPPRSATPPGLHADVGPPSSAACAAERARAMPPATGRSATARRSAAPGTCTGRAAAPPGLHGKRRFGAVGATAGGAPARAPPRRLASCPLSAIPDGRRPKMAYLLQLRMSSDSDSRSRESSAHGAGSSCHALATDFVIPLTRRSGTCRARRGGRRP